MAIDILNPDLGLQSVLSPLGDGPALPEAGPLASNVVTETSLARHFDLADLGRLIDRALIPEGIDERLLRPEAFKRNLAAAYEAFKSSRRSELRRFAREDLAPIMEDEELFALYAGLLVGS